MIIENLEQYETLREFRDANTMLRIERELEKEIKSLKEDE